MNKKETKNNKESHYVDSSLAETAALHYLPCSLQGDTSSLTNDKVQNSTEGAQIYVASTKLYLSGQVERR